MTRDQELHLLKIISETRVLINNKYRAGQQAHGGNLFDLSPEELIDEAINEAIDQLVYLITAKQKLILKQHA